MTHNGVGSEGNSHPILRLLRNIALIDLVLIVLTPVVCVVVGWRTVYSVGLGLVIAGLGLFAVGFISLLGGVTFSGNFRYRYSQTVMPDTLHERTQRNMQDVAQSWSFAILMGAAAVIPVLLGMALMFFFP